MSSSRRQASWCCSGAQHLKNPAVRALRRIHPEQWFSSIQHKIHQANVTSPFTSSMIENQMASELNKPHFLESSVPPSMDPNSAPLARCCRNRINDQPCGFDSGDEATWDERAVEWWIHFRVVAPVGKATNANPTTAFPKRSMV